MDFNSPLLKAMPQQVKRRPGRTLLLVLTVLFWIALIAVPIALVTFHTLPNTGVGHTLYWVHDHIFLPIKGYTYTLFFPLGLVFWGPVLFMIILWVVSYLSPNPIFKGLQIYLTRKAVQRRLFHPLLVKTSGKLKKWRMRSELLKEVTAEQRKKAFNRLSALPLTEVDRGTITSAVRLTQLYNRLITLPPSRPSDHLEAAVYWEEIYMRLRPRLTNGASAGGEWLERLTVEWAACIDGIIVPLLQYKTHQRLEAAKEKKGGFDTLTLAVDLLYLASLKNNEMVGYILGPKIPLEKRKKVTARRLAASTASRRSFLDRNRSRLESRSPLLRSDILTAHPADLPFTGRLSLLIALDLAAFSGSPGIGLGFLESIETLDFVLHLRHLDFQPSKEKLPTGQDPYHQKLKGLINGLPRPADYRFCAEQVEVETNKRKEIWQQSQQFSPGKDGLIRPGDFQLADTRVRALYHAAGPEFERK